MSDAEKGPIKTGRVAVLAIATNAVLTLIKFILAFLTGSLALLAEAFHSFADIASSFAVYLAIRVESREKPFSGSRFALFFSRNPQRKVAILIGFFLLAVSISIFNKMFAQTSIDLKYPVPAALCMMVLALFSFLLSRLERAVGEKYGATALTADGYHARVDMFVSLFVAIVLIGESLFFKLDRIAAGVIALFIFIQAINVFVLVAKDILKKEKQADYLYPEWLLSFSNRKVPATRAWLVNKLGSVLRIDMEKPGAPKRVERIIFVCLVLIALVLYALSGFYSVESHELAIVERFGRPLTRDNCVEPGLHYRIPWPVDRIQKINALRVRRKVIGSEISPETAMCLWTNLHYIREFNLLSGENIFIDAGMVLHYRISSPYDYVYHAAAPETILEKTSYRILIQEIGRSHFFDLVTERRDEIEQVLTESIRRAVEEQRLGIEVLSVNLRDLHPPIDVAPDFEDVISAAIDYETFINEAHGYSNELIPRARGEAEVLIEQAGAGKDQLYQRSKGESRRFLDNLAQYQKAKNVSRYRHFLESVEQFLADREKYIVPPEAHDGAVDLYVIRESARPLSREGQRRAKP
ncbi:FtsH protease activity modulator HflK [Acidobacteriota bacterium]